MRGYGIPALVSFIVSIITYLVLSAATAIRSGLDPESTYRAIVVEQWTSFGALFNQ
jgi:hypothetical protein